MSQDAVPLMEARDAGEGASLAVSKVSPPSVAREELCLVVRAQAGSHDSLRLFLLISDSLNDL
jgi:hypothetical protein